VERERALAAARAEAQAIVERAQRLAAEEGRAIVDQARAHAERIRSEAEQDAAREREAALVALRNDVVELALAAAGKVLERKVGEPEDRRLVEEFVADLGRQS